MKYNKIIKYLLAPIVTVGLTACGSSGGSSSNMSSVKDSDGDGFYDAIDPAPNDASNPGDFSSPEKILANPAIKVALQAAKDHGVPIRADLGDNPPNLTGYYRQNSDEGIIVTTSTGLHTGVGVTGYENRVRTKGTRYENASVYFDFYEAIGYVFSKGSMLRGEGTNFTTYEPYKAVCTENGANYATYGININSATQYEKSGNLSRSNRINVRLASSGTLTSGCDDRLPGNASAKWVVYRMAASQNIKDASDLNYMCVDDNKAYIPKETWTNSDKESCKCTTDYEVECK